MTKEQFTKKWENYWYYHKLHTVIAVFVLIMIVVLVQQCASRVNPDMTVMVITKNVNLSDGDITKIDNILQKYTADVNHNGQKNVSCDNYEFGEMGDPEVVSEKQVVLDTDLSMTNNTFFVTDESYYSSLNSSGSSKNVCSYTWRSR